MSRALQPLLRTSTTTSIPATSKPTTYICHSCRQARLLKRPKRPYTFTQLVTLSDGSAYTTRTTSPVPVYRSSRDTRNAPLWNPSSKELLSVEEDEAGRLAGFRARFGASYDVKGEAVATTTGESDKLASEKKADTKGVRVEVDEDDGFGDEFDQDDAGLLEMISSFGKEDKGSMKQVSKKQR